MFGNTGSVEIIVVLVIVILLFGPGRIGKVASELGSGIRNFRNGLQGKDETENITKDAADGKPKDSNADSNKE